MLPSAAGEPIADAAVLVTDGVVTALGDAGELAAAHPAARRAGGPGMLVMPGLVNAHQHAEGVSTFQMGFVDEPFEPWMALMHALPSVDAYLTTLYKSMLMLTSGVTTHVHSHFPAKHGYGDDPAGGYLAELEGARQRPPRGRSAHRARALLARPRLVRLRRRRAVHRQPAGRPVRPRAGARGRSPDTQQRLHRCHHRAAPAACEATR